MTSSLFSSLSPHQQAQAASMFLDRYFGTVPSDYIYELDAATGRVTGRHLLVIGIVARQKKMTLNLDCANSCILNDGGVRLLVDLVLEQLSSVPVQAVSTCAD